MLLFSISVHEQPKVIADQVLNFLKFNPDAHVVLHVSAWMSEAEFSEVKLLLKDIGAVSLNTTRLWSGYGDGTQMKMHVLNFRFAVEQKIPFEFFCLHASNDLFVKAGLKDYIKQFDCGYNLPPDLDSSDWVHLQRARADANLKKMMRTYGLPKILGGQVEGSFYRKDIMQVICDRIYKNGFCELGNVYSQGTSRYWSRFFNGRKVRAVFKRLAKGVFYAKEEFYFPTLGQDHVQKRAPYNYCYVNWQDNLNVTRSDIDSIRNGDYKSLRFFEHHNVPLDSIAFFAVKRVDRKIDDPLRTFVRNLSV